MIKAEAVLKELCAVCIKQKMCKCCAEIERWCYPVEDDGKIISVNYGRCSYLGNAGCTHKNKPLDCTMYPLSLFGGALFFNSYCSFSEYLERGYFNGNIDICVWVEAVVAKLRLKSKSYLDLLCIVPVEGYEIKIIKFL